MVNFDRIERLAKEDPLTSWEGYVADPHIARCRVILKEAAQALHATAANDDAAEKAAVLERAVEQLNDADAAAAAADGHFITTIEREDLCDYLGRLGDAIGLSNDQIDAAFSARDW